MHYTIGEFARKMGISIHTLRYYEKEQLLKPHRLHNDRRSYSEQDVTWLAFVIRLKQTGMLIKDIQTYARLREQGDSTLQARMNMLKQHRLALKAEIEHLQHHLVNLEDKIAYYQEAIAGKLAI